MVSPSQRVIYLIDERRERMFKLKCFRSFKVLYCGLRQKHSSVDVVWEKLGWWDMVTTLLCITNSQKSCRLVSRIRFWIQAVYFSVDWDFDTYLLHIIHVIEPGADLDIYLYTLSTYHFQPLTVFLLYCYIFHISLCIWWLKTTILWLILRSMH